LSHSEKWTRVKLVHCVYKSYTAVGLGRLGIRVSLSVFCKVRYQ
jgi:hypothetical protein